MLVLAVCLFSAVAGTVSAADRPVWFLNDDKSVTADGCDTLLKSGGVESTNGAIYIPEDKAASICIRFPDTVTLEDGRQLKGGWRHHFGSRGVCSQGCCEYFPPGAKKADIKHPAWFETSSDCSNAASKQSLPLYVQGQVSVTCAESNYSSTGYWKFNSVISSLTSLLDKIFSVVFTLFYYDFTN